MFYITYDTWMHQKDNDIEEKDVKGNQYFCNVIVQAILIYTVFF